MTGRCVTATIVDLPTIRPHGFATTTVLSRSTVVVEVHDGSAVGIGEGVVPGGPWWSGESVESIKMMIDRYLAPTLEQLSRPLTPRAASQAMDRVVAGNRFAKAAIDMALWDLAGKRAGCSIAELLGGALRTELPVIWALSSADDEAVLEEAQVKVAEGHQGLKFKMGALEPDDDVTRVLRAREKVGHGIRMVIDPNGAWDEPTALRALSALAGAVDVVEQPTPGWNTAALTRLQARLATVVMADESAQSPHEVAELARLGAVRAVSVKLPKAGGVLTATTMADIARSTGIAAYGGSTLETSIGASASAQVYATWPELFGCELVGPLLLADEVVTEPIGCSAGVMSVPTAPGLGVELDRAKLRRYSRD